MFYGAIIKPGAKVTLSDEGGEVLHLSGACLANAESDERVFLVVNQNNTDHILCVLKKDVAENAHLDLFFPTKEGGHFKVMGKGEVHISGYYEPAMDSEDEEGFDGMGEVSSDEDENDDDEDMEETMAKVSEQIADKKKKQGKAKEFELTPKMKAILKDMQSSSKDSSPSSTPSGSDDEEEDNDEDTEEKLLAGDDSEDDDEENENADDSEEDEDNDDDDSADEELARQVLKLQQKQKQNKQSEDKKKKEQKPTAKATVPPTIATTEGSKKRKAQDQPAVKAAKQTATGAASGSSAATNFEKAVTDYLKKHGRSLISQVSSSCPKPAAVTMKYKEFLVSRGGAFNVENQHVSLKQ